MLRREFFRAPAGFSRERIVLGHAAVVVQTDHRSVVIAGILRAFHLATVTESDVEVAFAVEHDARAEVISRTQLGLHPENDLHIFKMIAFQHAARHFRSDAIAVARRERQIHAVVFGKLRMQCHIQQSALAYCRYVGNAADSLGIEFEILADDTQAACAFCHQHAPVRQESQRPGVLQPVCECVHAYAVLLRRVGLRLRSAAVPGHQRRQQYFHNLLI
jgi:hypothetical protein